MNTQIVIDKANTCLSGCFQYIPDKTVSSSAVPFQTQSKSPPNVSVKALEMKDARKLLAEEMNKLSLQEREKVFEDVHGVGKVMEENCDLISSALNQLDMEIINIQNKFAYVIEEQISKEFVHDITFRLQFLRATCFDPVEAAHRLVRFFELKLQLFGREKLTKPITLHDLDEEDIRCLQSGRTQLLPFRDRAGRTIIGNFGKRHFHLKSVDAMLRAVWYVLMSALEDEETQRQGIVLVFYLLEAFDRGEDPKEEMLVRRASEFSHALPYRVAGVHVCVENTKSKMLALVAAMMTGTRRQNLARMRFHYGSHTECQFALMSFGIPIHIFPVTSTGDVKVDNHFKWIHRRRSKEQNVWNGRAVNTIDLPTKYDVLLGRGRPIQNHSGNEHFRDLINEYATPYKDAKRGKKVFIANTILQVVRQTSGRFIKQENDGRWIEVSDDIAIEKVCTCFRTLRATQRAASIVSGCFNRPGIR